MTIKTFMTVLACANMAGSSAMLQYSSAAHGGKPNAGFQNNRAEKNTRELTDIFDFTIQDVVLMTVDALTNPNLWSITLDYGYYGPQDIVPYVAVLRDDCLTDHSAGPVFPVLNPPLYADDSGALHLKLAVDIPTAKTESVLWTLPTGDPSQARLAFCVRSELHYDSTFVNFVATQVEITVTNSGDFLAFDGRVDNVQTADVSRASSQVDIGYTVRVYRCDGSGYELDEDPAPVTPGRAVRVCVSLLDPENHPDVYVSMISQAYYRNDDLGEVQVIGDGAPMNSLSFVDCTSLRGVCRLEFIPAANYFYGNHPLFVSGTAQVSFSQGGDNPEDDDQGENGSVRALLRRGSFQRLLPSSGSSPNHEAYFSTQINLSTGHSTSLNEQERNHSSGDAQRNVLSILVFIVLWMVLVVVEGLD